MLEYITVGKIIGAHGIRGEVKVFPITDNVRRFSKLKKCYLSREDGTIVRDIDIKSSRLDRGNVLIVFDGVDDRNASEKLKGFYLSVDRDSAVKLPRDSYFIADLIGLEVVDDELGLLGRIVDVFETGANQVIEVRRQGKKNLLIPFLKAVCYEVDIESLTMRVRLPDGLFELYQD